MRRPVMIDWGLSSLFGWGVYGLNLALAWARDPDLAPVGMYPIDRAEIVVDPLRLHDLAGVLADTERNIQFRLRQGVEVRYDDAVLASMGNNLRVTAVHQRVVGSPTIGIAFFEDTSVSEDALTRAGNLACIVAGSTWNAEVLRGHGVGNVATVIQGIDPSLFHPAARLGILGDRFKVFSGGKLEFRKGQDIVMAAFARFARAHPDALLVTAWHSPWQGLGRSLDVSGRAAPLTYDAEGRFDLPAWAEQNGLPRSQFLDLGSVPNGLLPPILREMDAALFTNRAEGGTNLVAMECMACGVPTILSANTGHLDLIDEDCCYPLLRQTDLPGPPPGVLQTGGWGESDVDEVVEALERAYTDKADAARRGAAGAARLARFTWAKSAAALKDIVLSFRPAG